MNEIRCFDNEERVCDKSCAAYNETDLNGTNCLILHARYAQANGINKVGNAVEALTGVLQGVLSMASMVRPS